MPKPICEKCKGKGTMPREGVDKDINPILSKSPTICDRCGGSGAEPPMSRTAKIEAAKADPGT